MSDHADEIKSGIETTIVPDVPTTCSPEDLPDEELLYDLADLFKVFSDTTRIKILYALMEQDLCVADLAEIIGASQSAVSHQLRTLRLAGIVRRRRQGKIGFYRIADKNVLDVMLSATDGILATRAS